MRRAATLRSFGPSLMVLVVVTALIVVFGLSRGWTTPGQYGLAFLIAGGAILIFGVFSLRSQRLVDNDPRPFAEQQRTYGVRQMIRNSNSIDRPQARTMMSVLGLASLPLLVLGLVLRFLL